MRRLAASLVLLALYASACALPGAGDIKLGACIRECNSHNRTCLDAVRSDCPPADACFDKMEACFDDATTCSDACKDCELKLTCTDEDDCNRTCSKMANACTDMIDPCIDLQRTCVDSQVDAKEDCVDTLVECIASCVEDAEAVIKGKK